MPVRSSLFHPLMFALYFVLALAATNAAALSTWRDICWPIGISLLVCGACWSLGYSLTRDSQKASALSLLWVVAFSVFGYAAENLRLSGLLSIIGGEIGLGVLFAASMFGPSLAIARTRRRLDGANRFLTLMAILLLSVASFQLWRGMWQPRESGSHGSPSILTEEQPRGSKPDIYLVILDKYTGQEVLAQHFHFDNSDFTNFLRSRGFVVPEHARANYPKTDLAIAAMLNLDYIQNLPPQVPLHALIEHNRLAAFLKRKGYRFVFFPTGFRPTFQNRNADLQLPPPGEIKGEFAGVWQRTTMLAGLSRAGCALLGCRPGRWSMVSEDAELMDWKFERMKQLVGGRQPTFVLAHLSLPHEPYIYWADCTHRDPYFPLAAGLRGDPIATRGYLDQVRCANRKLAALVDSILARSIRPTVILLQADHGHGRLGSLPEYRTLSPYQLRERMSVFSAYLMPGVDPAAIGDSVTPINALRLVLRHYFGADLPPMADASYWSTERRPLDFVRVE